MVDYKELFYRSQAVIADTIEKFELISDELKKCMQDCEEKIISEDNKITIINKFEDS